MHITISSLQKPIGMVYWGWFTIYSLELKKEVKRRMETIQALSGCWSAFQEERKFRSALATRVRATLAIGDPSRLDTKRVAQNIVLLTELTDSEVLRMNEKLNIIDEENFRSHYQSS